MRAGPRLQRCRCEREHDDLLIAHCGCGARAAVEDRLFAEGDAGCERDDPLGRRDTSRRVQQDAHDALGQQVQAGAGIAFAKKHRALRMAFARDRAAHRLELDRVEALAQVDAVEREFARLSPGGTLFRQ